MREAVKMKMQEKVDYLFENHYQEFVNVRMLTDQEVSGEHPMRCVCKRLCTGMHERSCSRFRTKVNNRAVKKLKHLLPKEVKA